MSTPERSYDPSQPFLPQIEVAVARTRIADSPFVEFFEDGSYQERFEFRKIDSADGIGTKGFLHWQARTFDFAAQDAFAMVYNDLLRDRTIPYKVTNTMIIEADDNEAIGSLISGLSKQCEKRGIAMGGGETAVLNTVNGFELDLTMTGAVADTLPNRYRAGDVLIGIPSNGIHSNGWSDTRRLYFDKVPTELLTPTRIYDEVPELCFNVEVHGLTHITGGGFGKLAHNGPDVGFKIDHVPQSNEVFDELYDRWTHQVGSPAQADQLMHETFNNGIGFVVGVHPRDAEAVRESVPDAETIGTVKKGKPGVQVRSRYTGQIVSL